MSVHRTRWLLEKELRELAASRSYWLLLLVIGALVGHQFMTATSIYTEASGAGSRSSFSSNQRVRCTLM